MEISKRQSGDFLELAVSGRLDAYWSEPLATALDEAVRGGSHRIRLNLAQVTYISSVGIRVLLKFYKQLQRIDGTLVVGTPSEAVKSVLELAGLQMLLASQAQAPVAAGSVQSRQLAGITVDVFEQTPGASLTGEAIGSADYLRRSDCAPTRSHRVRFDASSYAVGVGAFGNGFDECRDRFGEFLAVAGAASYLPTDGSNVPDYLLATGAFVPELEVLYGVRFAGSFAALMRFESGDGHPLGLSRLASAAFELCSADAIGMVILAESAGLLGAGLRHSPAAADAASGEFFSHPQVRTRLSFSPERCHARSLALIVGIASRRPSAAIAPLLRPIAGGTDIAGHFHAAAFSYRPLPKGPIDLGPTVASLFEAESLQGLIHLIGDDRPAAAIGESELLRGACWCGPILMGEAS